MSPLPAEPAPASPDSVPASGYRRWLAAAAVGAMAARDLPPDRPPLAAAVAPASDAPPRDTAAARTAP
jgi:hypothetical protein